VPELPEVETMVRGLRPALVGSRLRSVVVHDDHLLDGVTADLLVGRATGAKVAAVSRRGKWVVTDLGADGGWIVIQPRMTGGFLVGPAAPPNHLRLAIELDRSPGHVWFYDARRLGKIAWYDGPESAGRAFARSHGPDALEIGLADLADRLARTARGIKPTLMDQRVLAGLGNIYADEVCFRAGLHPEKPASSLTPAEVERVHAAIGRVLAEAIAAEGSSFDAGYRTVLGLEGGFLAQNAVHRRRGKPCPSCGVAIVKAKIAGLIGRPTYYCPACQPAPVRLAGRGGIG